MASGKQSAEYTCQRTPLPITIDGNLDKKIWQQAKRTPCFAGMQDGKPALFNTQAALLWDDAQVYAAFWLDERDIWSTQQERIGLAWQENAVEIYIAGRGAYYHLAVNPMNQTSELFVIFKDSYARGGRYDVPEFDLATHKPSVHGGDGGPHHTRGMRWAFYHWHFPGLQTAVRLDGTLNQRNDIDTGWTVEIALPWEGMKRLADGSVPAQDGDLWRLGVARNQVVDQRANRYNVLWTPNFMGQHDFHMPEQYPEVRFVGA